MKLKNAALQELYDKITKEPIFISPYGCSPIDKAFRKCDNMLSDPTIAFDVLKNLHDRNDELEKSNGSLMHDNLDLFTENKDLKTRIEQLEKDVDEAKSSVEYFKASRNNWRSRARYEEEEKIEQVKRADSLADQVEQLKNLLNKVNSDRTELQKDRDIWFRKNGEKLAEIAELKKQLDGLRDIGYEQGQTDLWDKLQKVNDSQPNEFDVECEGMEDVIGMDLEDFLDAYKKWQEEKETDRMGKLYISCPLHSYDFKCGRGSWFSDMSAEDIKRHYEKAVGHGRYTLKDAKLFVSPTPTMEGVNEAIKNACENFCKAVRDADIKIKENIPRNAWECTLEAKVEVNKDLLNEVCGIVPVEKPHKFEYGDAVRLPWRDYDYMYIGPEEGNETIIRMFDPKNHCMVTSHIENVRYNGGKIILTSEDDLRKIWKDKK